jgi:hypothetical protein
MRRVASVLAGLLYLAAFVVARSPWLLIVLALLAALEIWIQRSTEVGWRIFRTGGDERQEALRNEIMATSYRAVIVLGLVGLLLIALSGAFNAPVVLFDADVLITRFGALILVALFLLPGHVSAWLEPEPIDEYERVNGLTD